MAADAGKRLSVRVTGRADGYRTAARTSKATRKVRLGLQWYREGRKVRRAHSSTFAPKVSDVGHTFTVRVTATKAGYTSTTLESAPTLAVASA